MDVLDNDLLDPAAAVKVVDIRVNQHFQRHPGMVARCVPGLSCRKSLVVSIRFQDIIPDGVVLCNQFPRSGGSSIVWACRLPLNPRPCFASRHTLKIWNNGVVNSINGGSVTHNYPTGCEQILEKQRDRPKLTFETASSFNPYLRAQMVVLNFHQDLG